MRLLLICMTLQTSFRQARNHEIPPQVPGKKTLGHPAWHDSQEIAFQSPAQLPMISASDRLSCTLIG